MNKKPLLSIQNLSVQFKVGINKSFDAVKNVSLDIYEGEIIGLVGESGSGKTTLGKSIMGIVEHSAGRIHLKDDVIPPSPKYIKSKINRWLSKNIQMIFQDAKASINPRANIYSTIIEGALNQKLYKQSKADMQLAEREWIISCPEKFDQSYAHKKDQGNFIEEILLAEGQKVTDAIYMEAYSNVKKSYFALKSIKSSLRARTITENNRFVLAKKMGDSSGTNKKLHKARIAELINQRDKNMTIEKIKHVEFKEKFKIIKQDVKNIDNYYKRQALVSREVMEVQLNAITYNAQLDVEYNKYKKETYKVEKISKSKFYRKAVHKAIQEVAISPTFLNKFSSEFSGGQNQRIAIARSLIVNPTLIVADEPISALDVSIQAQIINLLKALVREKELTLLFIAHDLQSVKYISDKIVVMYRGEILEIGTADEVYNNPIHPYTQSLIESVPSLDDETKILKATKYVPQYKPKYIDQKEWVNISDTHKVFVYPGELATTESSNHH